MKRKTSISTSKIKVLNKNGNFAGFTIRKKAEFSVLSDKSLWVDKNTIQVLYHYEDEMAFKREVYERDGYTCYICDEQMHEGHPDLTVDHIKPKRLGGSILPKNMACCCKKCNEQKGHRTFQTYFYHLYAGLLFMVLWSSRWYKGGLSSGDKNKKE